MCQYDKMETMEVEGTYLKTAILGVLEGCENGLDFGGGGVLGTGVSGALVRHDAADQKGCWWCGVLVDDRLGPAANRS